MTVLFKIRHIGDSRFAWRILSIIAGMITFGFYILLAATIGVRDGLNGAWAASGLLASFTLCVVCWNTGQNSSPKLISPVTDGPLTHIDAEWGPLTPELRNQIQLAAYEDWNPDRWFRKGVDKDRCS